MPAPQKGTEPGVGYSRDGDLEYVRVAGAGVLAAIWEEAYWELQGALEGETEPSLTSTGGVPERGRGL
jgi:hypothetical protein